MKMKTYFSSIIFFFISNVFGMDSYSKDAYTIIKWWADYHYKQQLDFNDSVVYSDERFPIIDEKGITVFFDRKKLIELYDKIPVELSSFKYVLPFRGFYLKETFAGKKPSHVVQTTFSKEQKKLLLQQLKGYEPSSAKMMLNACLGGLSLLGVGASAYFAYSADDIKIKLGCLGAGILSCFGMYKGTKNAIKTYQDRSWWQNHCPNFQYLMNICKEKPK